MVNLREGLRMAAPYIAVGIFWVWLKNAWMAIFVYHAQIAVLNWPIPRPRPALNRWQLALILPAVLAGPLVYFLLPSIAKTDLGRWMEGYGLNGVALGLLIPYFGLIHPWLEQQNWHNLWERFWWSAPVFAGYHMLVLYELLELSGLVLVFVVLTGAAFMWGRLAKLSGSCCANTMMHAFADFGIILAAWFLVRL